MTTCWRCRRCTPLPDVLVGVGQPDVDVDRAGDLYDVVRGHQLVEEGEAW